MGPLLLSYSKSTIIHLAKLRSVNFIVGIRAFSVSKKHADSTYGFKCELPITNLFPQGGENNIYKEYSVTNGIIAKIPSHVLDLVFHI